MQPLSHHEILALVAPFVDHGWHVDLAASRRQERSLAFKPHTVPGATDGESLQVELRLDSPASGACVLTRTVTAPDGLQARLVTEGAEPAELLARLQALAPVAQFERGAGYAMAFSHRVEAGSADRLRMTDAVSHLEVLRVRLNLPKLDRMPAELSLQAPTGDVAELPEDLLAVLGTRWTRLARGRGGWVAEVRLRGRGEARGRDARARLAELSEHLVRTLAEPPAAFHQRHAAARWGVMARRGVPLVVCLALIVGALAVPSLQLGPDSVFRMLIFNSPPLLLVLFFSLRETPRIEIPPWPRRLKGHAWRTSAGDALPRADGA